MTVNYNLDSGDQTTSGGDWVPGSSMYMDIFKYICIIPVCSCADTVLHLGSIVIPFRRACMDAFLLLLSPPRNVRQRRPPAYARKTTCGFMHKQREGLMTDEVTRPGVTV